MAYDPTSEAQNAALAREMANLIDLWFVERRLFDRLSRMASGQGIITGLQGLGTNPVPGLGVPANVMLAAVQSLAAVRNAVNTAFPDGNQNEENLLAWRDSLGVNASAPASNASVRAG